MSVIKPILILTVLLTTLLAKGVSASWLPEKFKVDYETVNIDFVTNKELVQKAQLFYKYPKRIKLIEKKEKGKTIFVHNPYQTYFFKEASLKGNPNELTIQKGKGSNLGMFFDELSKNGLNNNKLYTVKKSGNKAFMTFTKEGVEKLELRKATMSFKSKKKRFKDLQELNLVLENTKELVLRDLKISTKIKLENNDFDFKTPPNTNIITE